MISKDTSLFSVTFFNKKKPRIKSTIAKGDDKLVEEDELDKKRAFKTVVVGEDVLGREITADGQSVHPSKDVPAELHVKFKGEL